MFNVSETSLGDRRILKCLRFRFTSACVCLLWAELFEGCANDEIERAVRR